LFQKNNLLESGMNTKGPSLYNRKYLLLLILSWIFNSSASIILFIMWLLAIDLPFYWNFADISRSYRRSMRTFDPVLPNTTLYSTSNSDFDLKTPNFDSWNAFSWISSNTYKKLFTSIQFTPQNTKKDDYILILINRPYPFLSIFFSLLISPILFK